MELSKVNQEGINKMNTYAQRANLGDLLQDIITVCNEDMSTLIVQEDSRFNFPNIGKKGKLYIAKDRNEIYRWDEINLRYYLITGAFDYDIIIGETQIVKAIVFKNFI